ncbi:hypothetical protein M758_UG014900 [Ceratodon purpureus]|nr:hypothetical protein M758_UG014900 [Ceratodon purpureus]
MAFVLTFSPPRLLLRCAASALRIANSIKVNHSLCAGAHEFGLELWRIADSASGRLVFSFFSSRVGVIGALRCVRVIGLKYWIIFLLFGRV